MPHVSQNVLMCKLYVYVYIPFFSVSRFPTHFHVGKKNTLCVEGYEKSKNRIPSRAYPPEIQLRLIARRCTRIENLRCVHSSLVIFGWSIIPCVVHILLPLVHSGVQKTVGLFTHAACPSARSRVCNKLPGRV